MQKEYEINSGTLCLIQETEKYTKVIEKEREFTVEKNIKKIVDESCKNFGSSLEGRISGTLNLTGIRYKTPIIVSEYLFIIILPTASPNSDKCHWISLNNLESYKKNNDKTLIEFISGKKIELEESYFIMQNQISKATRLDYFLRRAYRKKDNE